MKGGTYGPTQTTPCQKEPLLSVLKFFTTSYKQETSFQCRHIACKHDGLGQTDKSSPRHEMYMKWEA